MLNGLFIKPILFTTFFITLSFTVLSQLIQTQPVDDLICQGNDAEFIVIPVSLV